MEMINTCNLQQSMCSPPNKIHVMTWMSSKFVMPNWNSCSVQPSPSRSMISVLHVSPFSPFTKMALVNCYLIVLGPFHGDLTTLRFFDVSPEIHPQNTAASMSPPTSKSMPACGQLRLKANHLPSLYLLRRELRGKWRLETGFFWRLTGHGEMTVNSLGS